MKNASGVPSNHDLLVGWDHPGRNLAPRSGDSRAGIVVGCLVELDSEPRGRLSDSPADFRGVLSDAGGEYQTVDSTQHCLGIDGGDRKMAQ